MDGPHTCILAEKLHAALAGNAVERIDVAPGRWQANVLLKHCAGQAVQRVHCRGKWLIFDFSHGVTWLCNSMGRAGWNLSAASGAAAAPVERQRDAVEERMRFPASASVPAAALPASDDVLVTMRMRGGATAELRGLPLLLTLPTELAAKHPEMQTLGPDPLDQAFDGDLFCLRLRQRPNRSIAAALLDQRVLAGFGNALKCETLFFTRLAPATPVSSLYASDLKTLQQCAQTTAFHAYSKLACVGHWNCYVYKRDGTPCGICGSVILVDQGGGGRRKSWYCPTCQPARQEAMLFKEDR